MSERDLVWLFSVAPGYRMIYAENMAKTGGPDGLRKTVEVRHDLVGNNGVMSQASRRAYGPADGESDDDN